MRAFQKANLAGLVDVSVIGYSDGFRVMRARDKQAAAAELAGAGEPDPAAETPRKFPIVRLPPARGDGLLVRVTTRSIKG